MTSGLPSLTVAESVLYLEDIEYSYGGMQVLFGPSLSVKPGEAVALLGTNGAGKSTLLNVASGLVKPSRGQVYFSGLEVTGVPAERLTRAGLVLIQGGRSVFADMTVKENLDLLSLTLSKNVTLQRERKDLALDAFPVLRNRLSQFAGSLSGGEQQQLALAKALILKPQVLCVDELSLGLAPVIVGDLIDVLRSINASGIALVVVEQSLHVAAELCDRAVFLEKGRVRFEGKVSDLIASDEIASAVFLGGSV